MILQFLQPNCINFLEKYISQEKNCKLLSSFSHICSNEWFLYFFKAHFWKELLSFTTFTKNWTLFVMWLLVSFFCHFDERWQRRILPLMRISLTTFFCFRFFVLKYKSWLQQDLQQKWIRKAFFGLFQVIVFYLILSAKLSFFTQDSTLDKNCIKCKWNCFL